MSEDSSRKESYAVGENPKEDEIPPEILETILEIKDEIEGCVGPHGGDWSDKLPFDEKFNLYDLEVMDVIPDVLVDLGDLTNDFEAMFGSEEKVGNLPAPQNTNKELNTTSIDWSQKCRYDEDPNLDSFIEQVGLPEVLVDLGDLTSDFAAIGPEKKFDDLPSPQKRKEALDATSMCDKKLKVGSSEAQNLTEQQGATAEKKPQDVLKDKKLNQIKTASAETGVKNNVGKVFDHENDGLTGKDHEIDVEHDKDDEK